MENNLINHYINLYRAVHWSNEGLSTEKLQKMTKKELEKGICLLEKELAINEHYSNY